MDYMEPFPPSNGHTHILVVVDYVTKWVEAIPTAHVDAATSLKMIKDIIFPRFGVPQYLRTDGGTYFMERTFRNILCKYGVTHRVSSPYHPQTSGQVELSNREIKTILEKTVRKSRSDWSHKLNDTLWAYRTTFNNPMGMSPYKMVYGKLCHLPMELKHIADCAIKSLNYD
jgi:hypothetical protein